MLGGCRFLILALKTKSFSPRFYRAILILRRRQGFPPWYWCFKIFKNHGHGLSLQMRQELRNSVTKFCICNNISISILLQRGTFTSFKLSWSSKIVKLTCRAEVSLTEEQNQWLLANQSSSKQVIWPESPIALDHFSLRIFQVQLVAAAVSPVHVKSFIISVHCSLYLERET